MTQAGPDRIAFEDVVIDFAGRRLARGGADQPLEPKAFAVLELLARSPGRAYTRDEILDAVWGHRHITQSVLNRVMSLLRQALGEDAQNPRRLHTVHGVGYRFDLPEPAHSPGPGETPPLAAPAADLAPTGRSRRHWWLAAAALLVVVTLAIGLRIGGSGEPAPSPARVTAAPRPSVAVLPFADLSQSRDQQYLADGIAEEILNQLAQAPALKVVGRTSSFSASRKDEAPREIGRKLGVAYLVEGSVRKDGDQLRITAQLIRAEDGTQLWSKTYAREMRDVFALQDAVSIDVAQALSVKLDVTRYNREQGGTTNVDAYERYLRWHQTAMLELFDAGHDRERLQLAREMVALDPQCVLCQDALATSLNAVAYEVGGLQAGQLRVEGMAVRKRIADMAPQSWIARRDRSNALWLQGKRAEAIALAREIAEGGPLNVERVWDYAYMLFAMGHLNETIALVEQVRAVEPTALFLSRDLQYDYLAARRHDDAEAEYRRGLALEGSELEPTYVAFIRQLAGKRTGSPAELRVLHQQLLRYGGDFDSPFMRALGPVLDDRAAMLALLRRALADEAFGGGIESAIFWANVADALGDADLAVAAIRKTLEAQEGFKAGAMDHVNYYAFWTTPYSGVRAHPEFKRLLVQAGVVNYWRQTGKWGDGCRPLGANDFQCE